MQNTSIKVLYREMEKALAEEETIREHLIAAQEIVLIWHSTILEKRAQIDAFLTSIKILEKDK